MEQIEEFTLVSEIGGGNFGKVFKAVNTQGQEFAVKKILTRGVNQKLKELIQNEIHAMENAQHPNILKLVKVITRDQVVYIVTELCTGGDLESFLKINGPVHEKIAKKWIRDLVSAMSSLKEKSIMHRDIKVANILLSTEDPQKAKVKLCDFGFSKYLTRSITQTQLGTPLYMAPEIFNSTSYNYKVDIWSLGVVSFEILCGCPPFQCFRLEELKRMQKNPVNFEGVLSESAKDFVRTLLTYDPAFRPDYEVILRHEFLKVEVDMQNVIDHIDDMLNYDEYEIIGGDNEGFEDAIEDPAKSKEIKEFDKEEQKKSNQEEKKESKILKSSEEEVKQQSILLEPQRTSIISNPLRQSSQIYSEKKIQELSIKIQSQKVLLDNYKSIQQVYEKDELISLFFLNFKSHIISDLISQIDSARTTYSNSIELGNILDAVFVELQMDQLEILEKQEKLQLSLKNLPEETLKLHIINEGYELVSNPTSSNQAFLLFQAAHELYPTDEVIFEFICNFSR
jgi:serine/threonine protein kinase